MLFIRSAFYTFILVLLTSCSSTPIEGNLENPIITGLTENKSDTRKKIKNSKYKYNIIYFDTRSPDLYLDSISHSYYRAKDFGENIKNGLLFLPEMENIYNFQKISKQYHNEYLKERYSYNDGPFIIGVNNDIASFTLSLSGMKNECITRFFQDIEQSVNIENLKEDIRNKKFKKENFICEASRVDNFNLEKIIEFIRNAYK